MDIKAALDYYKGIPIVPIERKKQATYIAECLKDYPFKTVKVIETGASQSFDDGCFGIFLGHLTGNNGKMLSVDNDADVIIKSKEMYEKFLPDINIEHTFGDSINFLRGFGSDATIVHLDSWDLDLKNPMPAMLHGFLEFQELENKMPIGSYIIIDDNFLKGSWIQWRLFKEGILDGTEEIINIDYDIIGKGGMIYHYCKNYNVNWKIIGDHYVIGESLKIVIQKVK